VSGVEIPANESRPIIVIDGNPLTALDTELLVAKALGVSTTILVFERAQEALAAAPAARFILADPATLTPRGSLAEALAVASSSPLLWLSDAPPPPGLEARWLQRPITSASLRARLGTTEPPTS